MVDVDQNLLNEMNDYIRDISLSRDQKEREREIIRQTYPNLKSGDLALEAYWRYSDIVGETPTIDQLKAYTDCFEPGEAYSKSKLAKHFGWDHALTCAFIFFAESARLIEPAKGGYQLAVCKKSFKTGNKTKLTKEDANKSHGWDV